MTNSLKKAHEKFRDINSTNQDVDKVNDQFFAPFAGIKEMYALQKGIEAGWELGFDAFRESPEYLAMKEALEFYGNEMSYTLDDYHGISGEMRSRVVLYGDSEERNDVYSYAGRRAREVLKAIEGDGE